MVHGEVLREPEDVLVAGARDGELAGLGLVLVAAGLAQQAPQRVRGVRFREVGPQEEGAGAPGGGSEEGGGVAQRVGVCVEVEDLGEGGLLQRGAFDLEGFPFGAFLDAFDDANGDSHLALAVPVNCELRQV